MMLFTREIEKKLQEQYPAGNDLDNQVVVAKIFDPMSQWTWYLLNQDPEDPDYLWAIVKGLEIEIGSVGKTELVSFGNFGLPLERDLYFRQRPAIEVWKQLLNGEHV
jgi:hypothetical protein